MSRGFQSFLTAVVIAGFGLIPLGLMAMTPSETQTPLADAPTTTSVAEFADLPAPRMEALDQRARTVITTPVPQIDGVTEEVARVLAANGFAGEAAVDGIPASIVRVLVDRGAVLTIAVDQEG